MASSSRPLLSVVVATRNDDHGLNLLRRTQTFVNALIQQSKRHSLPMELILVEWNSPADRPRLREALHWPADLSPCQVRIINVPRQLHQRRAHSSQLPLFQMIAKNVGIRRARGHYVLATNIDILFSDELAEFLVSENLRPGRLYRTDRVDVMSDVPVDGSLFEQLDYCRTHHLRVNARDGTFPLTADGEHRRIVANDIASVDSGFVFGPGWFPAMSRSRENPERWRLVQRNAVLGFTDPADSDLLLSLEVEPVVENCPPPFELQLRDDSGAIIGRGWVEARQRLYFEMTFRRGEFQRLHLHLPQASSATPHDPHLATLRVLKCRWSRLPVRTHRPRGSLRCLTEHLFEDPLDQDVAQPGAGIRFGAGWWQPENEPSGLFRWATGDALLTLTPPFGHHERTSDLCLEIEPGPGVGDRAFDLEVWDLDADQMIAHGCVPGRRLIRLKLPHSEPATKQIRLKAVGGGERSPGDDRRILNFRIYRCFWSPASGRTGGFQIDHARPWTARCFEAARALVRAVPRRTGLLWRQLWRDNRQSTSALRQSGLPFPLHTNACGDFTLMAREDWHRLRGYAEFEMYSLHIDSLLFYAAAAAGIREVLLEPPMCVYHIEHSLGSGSTPEGEALLLERMARRGIPVLQWPQVVQWGFEMKQRAQPKAFNDSNWGLAEETLEEVRGRRSEVGSQRSESLTSDF